MYLDGYLLNEHAAHVRRDSAEHASHARLVRRARHTERPARPIGLARRAFDRRVPPAPEPCQTC